MALIGLLVSVRENGGEPQDRRRVGVGKHAVVHPSRLHVDRHQGDTAAGVVGQLAQPLLNPFSVRRIHPHECLLGPRRSQAVLARRDHPAGRGCGQPRRVFGRARIEVKAAPSPQRPDDGRRGIPIDARVGLVACLVANGGEPGGFSRYEALGAGCCVERQNVGLGLHEDSPGKAPSARLRCRVEEWVLGVGLEPAREALLAAGYHQEL